MSYSINPILGSAIFLCFLVVILVVYIINKLQLINILKKSIERLNKTVRELDYQAKLIIKGDMELKLYQEEVEDKLNKLTLLKNLIISSLHILDKENLFSQIDDKTINDLGFKKGLILTMEGEIKLSVGFKPKEVDTLKDFVKYKKNFIQAIPLISAETEAGSELITALQTKDFLIAPIKAREKIYAVFVLANLVMPTDVRRAEKEIFSIICMYLGQCLDNIQLFEEIYNAKDELERKVKERTNELVKSLREIEAISRAKSDFISNVSHELRTPLTSVKGFSSLLVAEKFGKLPEEAKKRLETIDENVDKLVNMVNTLLDIARIESGKTEVKIAPADIAKLIRDTGEFLSPQMQAKSIKLVLDTPETLLVYMDKNLIDQVFINLIGNAVKFTPEGGQIKLSVKTGGNQAVVTIADTGYGIEKENLEKIFQEFFRVDNSINVKAKGTGLGLSLVKRIIEIHKEKIWVESEMGKGSTFCFTLKLAKEKNI
ncbi:MAG: ATP-binding protein [Candidatus Omnitrophica bacterium]|jgi:signal transduction histidine kinase|nr:ATP-binding protein [Candidatus Omnitrophota bacterium]